MLRSAERTPAGRLVEADDIAGAVSFLCSDDAAMVCGQTLVVDGGFSLPGLMEPTDHNRRAFDDAAPRPPAPRAPGCRRSSKATLGDLTEKRVLHLQCGTGEASAELAEQGAVVTAVDPSEQLLDEARERWPKILWIQADAQALPAELRRGRFDLVYSPEGVIGSLDRPRRAGRAGSSGALQPRGELLVYDDHPVALCVDGLQHWHYDYFEEGFWRLGRIVTTLVRAGFRVEALEEYPGERRVPGTFLLYARRVLSSEARRAPRRPPRP